MRPLPNALFLLEKAANRMAQCDAFKCVCNLVKGCPYIDLESVEDKLSDSVDAFATFVDFCTDDELTTLISHTDPRVICLAGYRITNILEFFDTLIEASIPFPIHYPEEYPVRAALIDIWRSYCRIIS